nr:hypothetical protein [Tanacetum cinerariifolium]
AKVLGFCGREWGEVVESSWSGGGVVRSGGRWVAGLAANMVDHPSDERYILIPRKISSLKAKQPKKPSPKRTRNVGKYKRAQLTTSSSSDSPPLDNGDLPSTKLSPSKEQQNEKTSTPPPRKKSLSPLLAPSKSMSSKSTHYTSSSYQTRIHSMILWCPKQGEHTSRRALAI